jgi:hypothetical protein
MFVEKESSYLLMLILSLLCRLHTGFGFVTGIIRLLHVHTHTSHIFSRCSVVASKPPTADVPLLLSSRTVTMPHLQQL